MNLPILLFVVHAVLISGSPGVKDGNKNDANGLHQSSKGDHQNTGGGGRTFINKALVGLLAASSLRNGAVATAVDGIPVGQVQAKHGVWKPESRDFNQYFNRHVQNNAQNLKSSSMEQHNNGKTKIVGNVGRRGLSKATNSAQKTNPDIFNDNARVVPNGQDPPRYEAPAYGN
ncbi:hypothetical protein GPALN_014845 [Globodera pallida]|nr:hypothetical protein GPALN_014845 [Globodera pallida]